MRAFSGFLKTANCKSAKFKAANCKDSLYLYFHLLIKYKKSTYSILFKRIQFLRQIEKMEGCRLWSVGLFSFLLGYTKFIAFFQIFLQKCIGWCYCFWNWLREKRCAWNFCIGSRCSLLYWLWCKMQAWKWIHQFLWLC